MSGISLVRTPTREQGTLHTPAPQVQDLTAISRLSRPRTSRTSSSPPSQAWYSLWIRKFPPAGSLFEKSHYYQYSHIKPNIEGEGTGTVSLYVQFVINFQLKTIKTDRNTFYVSNICTPKSHRKAGTRLL